MMNQPEILSASEYELLCGILDREYGVNLRGTGQAVLRAKIDRYCARHGLATVADGIRHIQADRTRAAELGDIVYSQSTHFNRTPEHFRFLVSALTSDVAAGAGRREPFTIWSLGCSTGQEPYTAAVYLRLQLFTEPVDPPAFQVIGSDCSRASLQTAEAGRYAADDVRRLAPLPFERCFDAAENGDLSVSADLRRHVRFTFFNLVTSAYDAAQPVDLILLRNALDFHSPASRTTVLTNVRRVLKPGGWLVLGECPALAVDDVLICGFEAVAPGCYRVTR